MIAIGDSFLESSRTLIPLSLLFWKRETRQSLQKSKAFSAPNPEGPARHLDASRQKLTPHCLAAIFDSQLPSPKLSLKMPPKLPLPHNRGHFLVSKINCPRGEDNCGATELGRPLKSTKIRGVPKSEFFECDFGPFPPTLFPSFPPPLSPSGPVHFPTTSSLFTSPFIPPFMTPEKLRFRYPSDLGTL